MIATNFVNQFNDKSTEEFVFGIRVAKSTVILHATNYKYILYHIDDLTTVDLASDVTVLRLWSTKFRFRN